MSNTERLKIPLVEPTMTMNVDLWNNAYNQIDRVCMAMVNLGTRTIDFQGNIEVVLEDIENLDQYTYIHLYPTYPSNRTEWKSIASACIRSFIGGEATPKLHLYCEGSIPTISIHINIRGEI